MIFSIPSITSGRMHKSSVQFLMRETRGSWQFFCRAAVPATVQPLQHYWVTTGNLQEICTAADLQIFLQTHWGLERSTNGITLAHCSITTEFPGLRDNYEYLAVFSPPSLLLKMCPESLCEAGCKCHQGSRSQPGHFCHCLSLIG